MSIEYLVVVCSTALIPKQLALGSKHSEHLTQSPDLCVSPIFILRSNPYFRLATCKAFPVFRTSPPFHLRVAELQHFKMAENVCSPWVPFVDVRCYPIRYLPPFLNLEWIAGKQRQREIFSLGWMWSEICLRWGFDHSPPHGTRNSPTGKHKDCSNLEGFSHQGRWRS